MPTKEQKGSATETQERSRPQFSWIAYYNEEDEVAKAVCLELGLTVHRPHLEDAVEELLTLTANYLDFHRGEESSTLKQPIHSEAWELAMFKFSQQCSANPESRGTLWACGIVD